MQLKAGVCPFEWFGGVIALRDEGFGALAQVLDGDMARVTQDPSRVDTEQQLDLVDPARMQWREVKDKPLIVAGVELIPYSLRAVGVEVVPHDVHPALGIGLRDLLHKGHEIGLGTPIRATADDTPRVHIQRGGEGLRAVADVFKLAAPRTPGLWRAVGVFALDGLDPRLLVRVPCSRVYCTSFLLKDISGMLY